jgi:hypothetical protein
MTTAELVEASKQNPQRPEDASHSPSGHAPLYDEHEAADLRTKWQNIQGAFVDDPQASVEQADQLVATAIQRLAEIFSTEKSKLQSAWSNGGEVSTEDMRQALRRYRSFFDRILSV